MSIKLLVNNALQNAMAKIYDPIFAEALVEDTVLPIEYDFTYTFSLSQTFPIDMTDEQCLAQSEFIVSQQSSLDRDWRFTVTTPGKYVLSVAVGFRLRRIERTVTSLMDQTGTREPIATINKLNLHTTCNVFTADGASYFLAEHKPEITINPEFISPMYYVPPHKIEEGGTVRVVAKPIMRMVNGLAVDVNSKPKQTSDKGDKTKQSNKEMKELLAEFCPPLLIPAAEEFRFSNITNRPTAKGTVEKIFNNVQKYRPLPKSSYTTPWVKQPADTQIFVIFNSLYPDTIYKLHHQFKNAKTGKVYELKEPLEYQTSVPTGLQKAVSNIVISPQFAVEKRDREWAICTNAVHSLASSNYNTEAVSGNLTTIAEFERAQHESPVVTSAYGIPIMLCEQKAPQTTNINRIVLIDKYGIIGLASGMCDWLHPGYPTTTLNQVSLIRSVHRSIMASSNNSTLYPNQRLVQMSATGEIMQSVDLGRLNEELRKKFPHLPPMIRITAARQAAYNCYTVAGQCEISLSQERFAAFRSFINLKKPKALKNVNTELFSVLAAMVLLVGPNGVVTRAWCVMDEPSLIYDLGRQTPEFVELSSLWWSMEGASSTSAELPADGKISLLTGGKKFGSIPGFYGKYALVHSYIDQLDVNKTKMDILFTLPRQAAIIRLCETNFPTPEDEIAYLKKLKQESADLADQGKINEETANKIEEAKRIHSAVASQTTLAKKGKSRAYSIKNLSSTSLCSNVEGSIPLHQGNSTMESGVAEEETVDTSVVNDVTLSEVCIKEPMGEANEQADTSIATGGEEVKPDDAIADDDIQLTLPESAENDLESRVPKKMDQKDLMKETIMFSKNKAGVVSAYFNALLGDVTPLCLARSGGYLHIIANSSEKNTKGKTIYKIEHIVITLPKWIDHSGMASESDKSLTNESAIVSDPDAEALRSDMADDIESILKQSTSLDNLATFPAIRRNSISTNINQNADDNDISVGEPSILSPKTSGGLHNLFLSKAHNMLAPRETLFSEIVSRYSLDEGYASDAKMLCIGNKAKNVVIAWRFEDSTEWNVVEVSQEHVVYAVKVKSPEIDIIPSF